MQLSLRQAKDTDFETVYRIKSNSIKPYIAIIWGWDETYQRKRHTKTFKAAPTKLIEYENKIVGYLVIKETTKALHIENIAIEEDFQNLGQLPIRLQVFTINTEAQRFYRSLGFEKTSKKDHHIQMERNLDQLP